MTVNEFMLKSGIPVHLKGFKTVERAIELCIEHPEITSMELYETVANECGISKKGVERRIRGAIKTGFDKMDKILKNMLFKNKVYIRNNDYIKTVAYAIKHHII